MTARVVVVGSLNLDLVVNVERHPGPGETVLGGDLTKWPGGKGANQALAAARAGAAVHLVGRVGDDPDGQRYLTGLASNGVDVSEVRQTADAATGTALITVSGAGENTIVVAPGANAHLSPEDVDASTGVIADADVVLVQLEIPIETVLRVSEVARSAGVRLVVNASPARDLPDSLVETADPLVVNEHEARLLGRAGPDSSACITHGAGGATWGDAAVTPSATDVVDTTGAGDVFAGTLAASLAGGATAHAALDAAVAGATEATTWPGAQGWRLG